jgi:Raf kinase inhibitor-like YbhB/YbcL family protein
MSLELRSPAFTAGAYIPKNHACEGEDNSPALSWSGAPKGTKSFAIIMDDPDAPPGTWVHWVLYDIPGDKTGLAENFPKTETLPDGSKHGACWGVSEFDRHGYYGPCPPPGKVHHYSFRLYALDKVLGLPQKTTKAALVKAMSGHVLGQAEIIGLYKR